MVASAALLLLVVLPDRSLRRIGAPDGAPAPG